METAKFCDRVFGQSMNLYVNIMDNLNGLGKDNKNRDRLLIE